MHCTTKWGHISAKNWHSRFRIGDRVELHPATDWWMRGARYGEVVRITKSRVRVRLDCGISASLEDWQILDVVE